MYILSAFCNHSGSILYHDGWDLHFKGIWHTAFILSSSVLGDGLTNSYPTSAVVATYQLSLLILIHTWLYGITTVCFWSHLDWHSFMQRSSNSVLKLITILCIMALTFINCALMWHFKGNAFIFVPKFQMLVDWMADIFFTKVKLIHFKNCNVMWQIMNKLSSCIVVRFNGIKIDNLQNIHV